MLAAVEAGRAESSRSRVHHAWPRRLLFVLAMLTAVSLLVLPSSASAASPPSVTLSGNLNQDWTADSGGVAKVEVNATTTGGQASGSLYTSGAVESHFEGPWYHFFGEVTCMVVSGNRVTVGAFGNVTYEDNTGPTELPGTYANILTVEYGSYEEPGYSPPPFTARFHILGKENRGYESATPPDCASASFENLSLSWGREAYLSPEISSPSDGTTVSGDSVTLSGIAQPDTELAVYEVGAASSGTVLKVGDDGAWSTTLKGLAPGAHVFTAGAIAGSKVASNTVEVSLVALAAPSSAAPGPSINVLSNVVRSPVVRLSLAAGAKGVKLVGRHLTIPLASNVGGNLTVAGYVVGRRSHRHLPVRGLTMAMPATNRKLVVVQLPVKTAKAIAGALHRGERMTAHLTLAIRTSSGSTHLEHLVLKVS
jgi:hypothetical protein